MENEKAAQRILEALENSNVPISWHCINEPALINVIAKELNQIVKEKVKGDA